MYIDEEFFSDDTMIVSEEIPYQLYETMEQEKPRIKEDHAVVLDFLLNGYPSDARPSHRKTPIVQAIGKDHFTLLELVPKKDVFLQPYEEVYIGEGKREKIHHINWSLNMEKLTESARAELEFIVKDIVAAQEKRFVYFFNKASPISTRMHQLELLPGVGKKHMWEIIEKRREKEFASFKDIKDRVKLMPDPEKAIVRRIVDELADIERKKIFVK